MVIFFTRTTFTHPYMSTYPRSERNITMFVALQIIAIVSIFIVAALNIEAHFEKKDKAKDKEYAKYVIESLYIANK